MKTHKIIIPGKGEYIEYDNDISVPDAFADCTENSSKVISMSELVDLKLNSGEDSRIWQVKYNSASVIAFGMTKRKKAVVIYAHCDNYLTNLENFDSLLTFNGLVIYPQKEFEKLYNMKDDKNVFVVPFRQFEDCDLGYIHLEDVLKHPQTVPFIGSKERAEALIELLGRKKIKGISIWPPTDLYEQPSGSYLTLRSQNSLEAEYSLNESGRFIGIPKKNI